MTKRSRLRRAIADAHPMVLLFAIVFTLIGVVSMLAGNWTIPLAIVLVVGAGGVVWGLMDAVEALIDWARRDDE